MGEWITMTKDAIVTITPWLSSATGKEIKISKKMHSFYAFVNFWFTKIFEINNWKKFTNYNIIFFSSFYRPIFAYVIKI